MEHHYFISYASEEKQKIAKPLFKELEKRGYKIWFDEECIEPGDSIRESIDNGLLNSGRIIIILSTKYIEKHWTKLEFNAVISIQKRIIPIWYQVSFEEVKKFSPMIADIRAISYNGDINSIVDSIITRKSNKWKQASMNEKEQDMGKEGNNRVIPVRYIERREKK